jgi:hypothetical protein
MSPTERPRHLVLMVKAPTTTKQCDRVAAILDPIESEDAPPRSHGSPVA